MKIGPSKETIAKPEESSEFVGTNIQYSYTNFSTVDHRIKLHIILNVFEHENEDLAFLLRVSYSHPNEFKTLFNTFFNFTSRLIF